MVGRCRDCIAWRKMAPVDGIRREIPVGLSCGECTSDKNNQIYEGFANSSDLWIVGADFGCIHFDRKPFIRRRKNK